jgi:hypothetical protein
MRGPPHRAHSTQRSPPPSSTATPQTAEHGHAHEGASSWAQVLARDIDFHGRANPGPPFSRHPPWAHPHLPPTQSQRHAPPRIPAARWQRRAASGWRWSYGRRAGATRPSRARRRRTGRTPETGRTPAAGPRAATRHAEMAAAHPAPASRTRCSVARAQDVRRVVRSAWTWKERPREEGGYREQRWQGVPTSKQVLLDEVPDAAASDGEQQLVQDAANHTADARGWQGQYLHKQRVTTRGPSDR